MRSLYALDFALPVSSAFFFTCLFGVLLKFVAPGNARWRLLLLLPWVSVPFDFLENTLALIMVGQKPDELSDGMTRAVGFATAAKMSGLALTAFALVVLLGVVLVTWVRRKVGGQSR